MKTPCFLLLIFSWLPVIGQNKDDCRVLVPNLQGSYEGGCRDGLAQGKGTASGTDSYTGGFRNGYPNGKGTYTWASGNVYKGEWNMGKCEGNGVFTGKIHGKDTVMAGIWKNGDYMGPKPSPPKVSTNYNVVSTSFTRQGEGNKITISFYQNGIVNFIENLDVTANSGNEVQSGNYTNIWDISFPFRCKINYKSWNSLKTQIYDCILEFEITEPGSWDLRVGN
jgi:hypothetical protein